MSKDYIKKEKEEIPEPVVPGKHYIHFPTELASYCPWPISTSEFLEIFTWENPVKLKR